MGEPNSADPQDASKANVISLNKTGGGGANGMHLGLNVRVFFSHFLLSATGILVSLLRLK